MKNGKDKLIVAIDTDNFDKAKELIDQLEDSVDIFKVGLEQYVATKGKTLEYLKEKGKKVFLDLKFHDIPNTMKSAVRAAVRDNVWLMTIHVSDLEGMRQCALVATEELVIKRAKLAQKAGIDGIVCSAKEVDRIVEVCGKDFVTVCPGIRPSSSSAGDQKRVVTPAEAIKNGAKYLVVGRPITQSENPKQSAIDIAREIENA